MPEKDEKKKFELIPTLDSAIKIALKLLSILMTGVIIFGVADVAYILYERLIVPPRLLLTITDILATFSGFMAVLIAIEIYTNMIIYLRDNIIHVKIVIATALMAVARKVIVLDLTILEPSYLYGIGVIMAATGVAYWLVHRSAGVRLRLKRPDHETSGKSQGQGASES